MSEAVGIVVAIGVAIVALVAILVYIQLSRFFEVSGTQLTRFVDATEEFAKDWSVALEKLGNAADNIKSATGKLEEQIEIVERDLSPAVQNFNKSLIDANPALKSISESSDDIRKAIEGIRRTAVDVADVADGVHNVIMPIVNGIRSLVTGLSEGVRLLKPPRE